MVGSVTLVCFRWYAGIFVTSRTIKRVGYKAIFACTFVFWFFGLGLASKVHASCGDYLHHVGSKSLILKQQVDSESDDLSSRSCKCKSGSCKSAPQPMPVETSRIAVPRQQPNHVSLCNISNAFNLIGLLVNADDLMPIAPSLDLPDPPPRAAVL